MVEDLISWQVPAVRHLPKKAIRVQPTLDTLFLPVHPLLEPDAHESLELDAQTRWDLHNGRAYSTCDQKVKREKQLYDAK
jgi:hypothetical protein